MKKKHLIVLSLLIVGILQSCKSNDSDFEKDFLPLAQLPCKYKNSNTKPGEALAESLKLINALENKYGEYLKDKKKLEIVERLTKLEMEKCK